jgi:hypothetical protein
VCTALCQFGILNIKRAGIFKRRKRHAFALKAIDDVACSEKRRVSDQFFSLLLSS